MPNVLAHFQGSELILPEALITGLKTLDKVQFRPSVRESLDDLISALDGKTDPAEIKKALTASVWQAVEAEWKGLKARALEKLPEKVRPLAFRLQDITGTQELPLFTADGSLPVGPHFKVEGGVSLKLDAQTLKEFEPPLSDGNKLLADQIALRLGLKGRVAVGISGGMTYGWGSVRAEVAASALADLDFYHARPSAEFLGISLLAAGPKAFAFANLASLRAARGHGLRRVTLDVNGKLSVSAGLTAGTSVVYEVDKTPLTLDPIKVTATAGAKLEFGASLEGQYLLGVDLEEDGDVTISIDRSTKADRSFSMELGVDVGIEGLAEQANAIVDRMLPSPAPLLKILDKYKDPIGLLKIRLQDAIKKALKGSGALAPHANSLALLLTGDTSAATVGDEISARIVARLTKALDRRVAAAIGHGDNGISNLAGEAVARLPEWLGPDLAGKIATPLKDEFEKHLKEIADGLEKEIKQKVKAAGANLADVLAPLEAIGKNVSELQAAVKSNVEAVVQPIKAFIEEYQGLREKVVAALEKTKTEKVSIKLAVSLTHTDIKKALFSCRLSSITPELEAFFARLWLGQLDVMRIQNAAGVLQPGVATVDGKFVDAINDERKVSFTLNFFGFEASRTGTRLSQVEVTRDLAGRIVMASSKGSYADAVKAFDYLKVARIDFGLGVKMENEKAVVDLPSLTTAYTVDDEKITFEGAMSYVQSLVEAGLLSRGGMARTKAILYAGDSKEERHLEKFAMALSLTIDETGWRQWLDMSESKMFDTFAHAYFEAAFNFSLAGWDFPMAITNMAGLMQMEPEEAFKEFCRRGSRSAIEHQIETVQGRSLSSVAPRLRTAYRLMRECAYAVNRVIAARETWRSLVELSLKAVDSNDAGFAKQLDQLNRKLTGQLAETITSALTLLGNEKSVPPLTSGFLLGMLRATGREVQLLPLKIAYEANGTHEMIVM